MCVCEHVLVYVSVCANVYVYTHAYVLMQVFACLCVCVSPQLQLETPTDLFSSPLPSTSANLIDCISNTIKRNYQDPSFD